MLDARDARASLLGQPARDRLAVASTFRVRQRPRAGEQPRGTLHQQHSRAVRDKRRHQAHHGPRGARALARQRRRVTCRVRGAGIGDRTFLAARRARRAHRRPQLHHGLHEVAGAPPRDLPRPRACSAARVAGASISRRSRPSRANTRAALPSSANVRAPNAMAAIAAAV